MQNRFGRFDSAFFQEIILSSGVFRRETASGFYPWGNVVGPRKRVAEGLCGGRHGNSFPMTQSAQLHRQMRSIPRCSKAVFLCFCFSPLHFSTEPIYLRHDDRHKAKRQRGEAVGWQAPPHCG